MTASLPLTFFYTVTHVRKHEFQKFMKRPNANPWEFNKTFNSQKTAELLWAKRANLHIGDLPEEMPPEFKRILITMSHTTPRDADTASQSDDP
jgi:hypothetical protein